MIRRDLRRLAQLALGELSRVWPLRYRLVRVRGHSMEPTLHDGDWVLFAERSGSGLPAIGALVVARSPELPEREVVKRVTSHGQGTFALGSDNPLEGRDSRHFGSLTTRELRGQVIWVWASRPKT